MIHSRERTVNRIELPFESYLFLQEEQHRQRSKTGKPLSEKSIDRFKRLYESTGGKYDVDDGYFGGCIGDPEHAWEEGRWTSWSCEDMIKLLDKEGLPYERKGKATVFDVYI